MQQGKFNWELVYFEFLMEEKVPVKPSNLLHQGSRVFPIMKETEEHQVFFYWEKVINISSDHKLIFKKHVKMEEEKGTNKAAKADGLKKEARQVPIAEIQPAIERTSSEKMKFISLVSSSRCKSRKAHFTTPLNMQHVLLSTPLSGDRQSLFDYLSTPVRKDNEVQVVRGTYKEHTERVLQVYREKWVIHIEHTTSKKVRGSPVNVGTHPSKVDITKLRLDKDRKSLLVRKA